MDIFTYIVSDDKGKLDKAKVSVSVKAATDSKIRDPTNIEIKSSQEQQAGLQEEDKTQLNSQADSNESTDATSQTIEKSGPSNETDSTAR